MAIVVKTVSVSYERKINLGDYNSAAVGCTLWADVTEDDATPAGLDGAMQDLWAMAKANVAAQLVPLAKENGKASTQVVETFLGRYAAAYARPLRGLSQRLIEAMKQYAFPGNVRELENMIKRIVVLESEDQVLAEILRPRVSRSERRAELDAILAEMEQTAGELPLREVGRRFALEVEREAIEHVLESTGWNRKQAAQRLGVSYKTLLQKIRECEVEAR